MAFVSHNSVMISMNNKIRNENPALTGSLTGSKRVLGHYYSQLQTWSKTWLQTCVSVSQACRKQVAS